MLAFFNAVNTYTDASIVKDPEGNGFITCAGFVTVFHGEIIDSGTQIVSEATNNYGEIMAIYMGIQSLLKFKDYDTFLNLFSDSRISVLGLREWIYSWVKNMHPETYILVNSSGTEVMNQEVFCNIVNYIVQNNTHLSLYHQRGHQDPTNVKDMEVVRESFLSQNNVALPDDIIREICYYNNMVDEMTRNILLESLESSIFNKAKYRRPKIIAARRVLNWNMLGKYKELIGG